MQRNMVTSDLPFKVSSLSEGLKNYRVCLLNNDDAWAAGPKLVVSYQNNYRQITLKHFQITPRCSDVVLSNVYYELLNVPWLCMTQNLKDRVNSNISCEREKHFHRNFQDFSVKFVKKLAVTWCTLTVPWGTLTKWDKGVFRGKEGSMEQYVTSDGKCVLWDDTYINNSITKTFYLNQSHYLIAAPWISVFEETSGYVRPERVNKWPNSMTDIWWWWW